MLTSSIRFCKQSIDVIVCSVCFVNGSLMVSNKTLLVLQPRQVSWSLIDTILLFYVT